MANFPINLMPVKAVRHTQVLLQQSLMAVEPLCASALCLRHTLQIHSAIVSCFMRSGLHHPIVACDPAQMVIIMGQPTLVVCLVCRAGMLESTEQISLWELMPRCTTSHSHQAGIASLEDL